MTTLKEYSFKDPNSELLAQPYMTEVSSIPRKKGFQIRDLKRKNFALGMRSSGDVNLYFYGRY